MLACLVAASCAALGAIALASARQVRRARARRGAEALLRSSARQDGVEQLAGLGSWIHDLHANTLHWSEGAFRLFGIDPAAGVPPPKTLLAHIHPNDQERWRETHRRAMKAGREVHVEFRWMRPNRDLIWVRSVGQPERDERGEIVRMSGLVQDITGIRAMQQQLAASEAKFRDLTHLSSDWIWETDAQHRVSFLSDSFGAVVGNW
ncbi:MAG TPA: PAS domain-containing protein, partial [Zeimonas sp.]